MARKPVGETRTALLADKIARLVREKGWTIQQFAVAARCNRHTAKKIIEEQPKWLRAGTVKACAQALGLSVDELTQAPLAVLLPRMNEASGSTVAAEVRGRQPALADWLEANPEHGLCAAEVQELASLQGMGGPLTAEGVAAFVERIRRKRQLLRHVEILAGTSYLPMLEELTRLMLAELDPLRRR